MTKNTTYRQKPRISRLLFLYYCVRHQPQAQSQYNNFDKRISAIVDYNDILYSPTVNKVEVRIGEMPMIYKNVSLNVDSVEYIIEKLDL